MTKDRIGSLAGFCEDFFVAKELRQKFTFVSYGLPYQRDASPYITHFANSSKTFCKMMCSMWQYTCSHVSSTWRLLPSRSLSLSHILPCVWTIFDTFRWPVRMLHQRWNAQPSSCMAKRMRQGLGKSVESYVEGGSMSFHIFVIYSIYIYIADVFWNPNTHSANGQP